ncbi:zinc-ribbon domain-containing protein [uncultured Jannaschia sp.]|uniref:zinc-ribbon domain-containing protein n=1 Tax=uncultured Jannaschia sp. TaxID=293347 RepID=UPI002625D3DA|nr:zinc-ribbon domain-containing protein [uncultured Jannaschia sp.]
MHIICPNCSVQYEIADDLIPSNGREVQCSNCGRTWYQDGAPIARTVAVGAARSRDAETEDPDVGAYSDDGAEDEDQPEDADAFEDEDPPEEDAAERGGEMPPPVARPSSNEAILRVLREERDHETQLRRTGEGPTRPVAEPTAPAVDAARERAAAERRRMAAAAERARAREGGGPAPKVRPEPPRAPRPDAEPPRIMRRELLPDIEEINSSLRPDTADANAARDEGDAGTAGGSTGFWGGFLAACAVVGLFVLAYAFAEDIAAALPAASGPLADYAAWIDTKRAALADWVEALTERILSET